MSHLSKDLKWTTALAIVLAFAGTVMASADRHRAAAAPFPIAYTQHLCVCDGASCEEWWCAAVSSVATSGVWTGGPADSTPSWSPDATHIAFVRSSDIMVVNAASGTVVNITNSASAERAPAWSPNGQRIAFLSDRDGQTELYLMDSDGSDIARVTHDGVVSGRPTWSPDSTRLAFGCLLVTFYEDVCAINADGTGFLRLTDHPSSDTDPAWSPDGAAIAFATRRYNGEEQLALMRPDGSDVKLVGAGIYGSQPAWSPDGRQIAFKSLTGYSFFGFDVHTIRPDGTDMTALVYDSAEPVWRPGALFASVVAACNGLTCTVDATHSVGNISAYTWDFGDQTGGIGNVATHTFALGGQYTVKLTVTDSAGATSTSQELVQINAAPVATFTVSCNEQLACVFDPSASHDPEGEIAQVQWLFGNGASIDCSWSSACLVPRTYYYLAGGTHTVTLRVTDAFGGTSEASRTFTLVTAPAHISDLDAAVSPGPGPRSATVTIEVHTASHNPYHGAAVTAVWDNGDTMQCVTDTMGRCTVKQVRISPSKSISVSITAVSYTVGGYSAAANHDPDGDSNGTTIIVLKR